VQQEQPQQLFAPAGAMLACTAAFALALQEVGSVRHRCRHLAQRKRMHLGGQLSDRAQHCAAFMLQQCGPDTIGRRAGSG